MCHNIWPFSIYVWLLQCGSWNVVLGAIDTDGTEIWFQLIREHWVVLWYWVTVGKSWSKVSSRQRSHRSWFGVIWRFCLVWSVIWDHFCSGVTFHSVAFLHSKWWGVMILDTFENVYGISWPTSTSIGQWNCEWWNRVISGIDAHGN